MCTCCHYITLYYVYHCFRLNVGRYMEVNKLLPGFSDIVGYFSYVPTIQLMRLLSLFNFASCDIMLRYYYTYTDTVLTSNIMLRFLLHHS